MTETTNEQTIAERSAALNTAKNQIKAERAEALAEMITTESFISTLETLRSLYDPTDSDFGINHIVGQLIANIENMTTSVVQGQMTTTPTYYTPIPPQPSV